MAEMMVVVVMIRMVGMMLMMMGMVGMMIMVIWMVGVMMMVMRMVVMRTVRRMNVCNVLSSFLFRPGCNLQGEVQASFGLISAAGPRSIGTCLNTFAITNMSDYVFITNLSGYIFDGKCLNTCICRSTFLSQMSEYRLQNTFSDGLIWNLHEDKEQE